ncbi:MAG TPA: pyruvate formate lyase family protein [Candidatus Latescibacteria bacterium]|nr:hypothetical protein [Gemmatimonadaceae bacterium]MDP6018556.1 pyruvate formate lyase family protein [Candidatus Latescibacterota bacterium]HJP31555.1 pyruvate formate lyase family protein [Candidatus Latescibacterota bacterium]
MTAISQDAVGHAPALHGLGEHFAAGYMEEPHRSPMWRWSRAVRRRFEHRSLPAYEGQLLYPAGAIHCGDEDRILSPSYSYTWGYDVGALEDRLTAADWEQGQALTALREDLDSLTAQLRVITTVHTVGGRGYTHSVPNYGRMLRQGLDGYAERLAEGEGTDLCLGLQQVVAGIRRWHARVLDHLRQTTCTDPAHDRHRRRLIDALEHVPCRPARSFFEAVVAYNFTYYLDDCDNPGRVDLELSSFYTRDLTAGHTTHEEARDLLCCLWENCDLNNGWSAGIGGTPPDGETIDEDLTVACLEAAHGMRRPNLQLHVRRDMPAAVWEAALETIGSGCGLPALYNEEAFISSLRNADLGIRESDLALYNGGGCTETMVHGLSNVGSLDAGINLPLLLSETLATRLATADGFTGFLDAYQQDIAAVIDDITSQVSAEQQVKARLRPQPMRSLLVDDCIAAGREFNAGGARYNWSVINVAGLATVVDSLAAVREVVFEKQEIGGAQLLEALRDNFDGQEPLRLRLARCPRFGNDEAAADELAAELSEFVFRQFLARTPWRGGRFLPSCLMFTTYAQAGKPVGATPDGRRAGEPIADSAGPHQGRDRSGPTAMLKSVASIPHHLAPGTLVVNARFGGELFDGADQSLKLRSLVRTYFDLGGMQLQINVIDQAVLEDAIAHPDRHRDLIVRIGGYSEYFNRLSPELKQTLLERTEHTT